MVLLEQFSADNKVAELRHLAGYTVHKGGA